MGLAHLIISVFYRFLTTPNHLDFSFAPCLHKWGSPLPVRYKWVCQNVMWLSSYITKLLVSSLCPTLLEPVHNAVAAPFYKFSFHMNSKQLSPWCSTDYPAKYRLNCLPAAFLSLHDKFQQRSASSTCSAVCMLNNIYHHCGAVHLTLFLSL